MKNRLVKYKNGNVDIEIYGDGTRIMEYDETKPVVFDFPTSMDIKITNQCIGVPSTFGGSDFTPCNFCHEESSPSGKHGDIEALKKMLEPLPGGLEMAIGGGNPLSHPKLTPFLEFCKTKNFIPSITVNFHHINKHAIQIRKLIASKMIYGLGVSIPVNEIKSCTEDEKFILSYPHTVAHIIIGLHKPNIIEELFKHPGMKKFLLLGYKEFGRGKSYFKENENIIANNIAEWKNNIMGMIGEKNRTMSFDNLAIEQLDMQSKLPKETWDKYYQGDDFVSTMYIDAVEQTFAPTSRSKDRVKWSEYSLLEYFNKFKQKL